MQYRSYADLANIIVANSYRLPPDIDVVVGIPRSGLLAASIFALSRNLPLADLNGFLDGRLLASGRTKKQPTSNGSVGEFKHALIMDDSINSGQSMREARGLIEAKLNVGGTRVSYCAVIGRVDSENDGADFILDKTHLPRFFQWNIFHHIDLARMCFDIDGVLCHDPTIEQNDDGVAYREFLLSARELNTVTRPIGHLVTSRLERYRPETEQWLADKGIQYGRLWMLDLPTAEDRRRLGSHGAFKASVYKKCGAILFVESEPHQAEVIAKLSGKPVLSLPDQRVVYGPRRIFRSPPEGGPSLPRAALLRIRRAASKVRKFVWPVGQ